MQLFLSLLSLASFASAHFKLVDPAARGFDEDTLGTFPCGGQKTVSSNRTEWSTKGGSIQLDMEHQKVAVQVLLGLGNDVGDAFNTVIMPIFVQEGFGDFCMGDVVIPSGLNITAGQNATIQVVTTGESGGGLYNCADITFVNGDATKGECTNGTGVKSTAYTGSAKNANDTNDVEKAGASETSTAGAAIKTAMSAMGMVIGGAAGIAVLL